MLTRQYYIIIATALRHTRPPKGRNYYVRWDQWAKDCNSIADMLEQDNPRFSRERFIDACLEGMDDIRHANNP